MGNERIWLAEEARDLITEDQERLLAEAGFDVAPGGDLDLSGAEPATILLAPPAALESLRAEHPDVLAIGLADGADASSAHLEGVLRSPLQPAVLRTLVEALRYAGPDRRWSHRVALGLPARMWSRRGHAKVTVADLSMAGGRLLVSTALDPGRRVRLWLPAKGKLGLPKRVSGRVVRCEAQVGDAGDESGFSLGVAWSSVSQAGRMRLVELLETHRGARLASSAAGLSHVEDESSGEAASETDQAATEGESQERRRRRRQVYDRRVIAKRPQGPSVLMGRDLSIGGIKVEPSAGLALGTELQIAVHGRQGTTPLVIDARVTRDDGAGGLVLEFENLDERHRDYLEKLVDELDAQEAPPTDDIPF